MSLPRTCFNCVVCFLFCLLPAPIWAQAKPAPLTETQRNQVAQARQLQQQARAAFTRADYATAIQLEKRVLDLLWSSLGEGNAETLVALNNLGAYYDSHGDRRSTRFYYEKALELERKYLGDQNGLTASTRSNYGLFLKNSGDLAAARVHLEAAVPVLEVEWGADSEQARAALVNVGDVLRALGDLPAAKSKFALALDRAEKSVGKSHPDTGTAHYNLGEVKRQLREFPAAAEHYESALRIRKQTVGEAHPAYAAVLVGQAQLFQRTKRPSEARTGFETALDAQNKSLGPDHPETLATSVYLSNLLLEIGDLAAARPMMARTLERQQRALGISHPNVLNGLLNLARLEASAGNRDAALDYADRERFGQQRHQGQVLPALSLREQLVFLQQNNEEGLHQSLSLGVLFKDDPRACEASARWLANGKAASSQLIAGSALMKLNTDKPDNAQLKAMTDAIRRQISELTLSVSPPGEDARRLTTIDVFQAKEEELVRQMLNAGGKVPPAPAWMELDRVRRAIPEGGVFIDIARVNLFRFDPKPRAKLVDAAHYYAWIIPARDAGPIRIVDLGFAEIIDLTVRQAREAVHSAAGESGPLRTVGEVKATELAERELKLLAQDIWSPIAEHLGGVNSILISPDAGLWLAPWAALPVGDGKFLIEKYDLRYLVSARDLVTTQGPAPPPNRSPPSIFANPNFSLSAAESAAALQATFPKEQFTAVARNSRTVLPPVAELPHTAYEAETAKSALARFTGVEPVVYSQAYAHEEIVKKVRGPRVLVLSTHGFALPVTANGRKIPNPYLRCGLLFAGCNQPPADQDGVLTALEIFGIDLQGTELVVLSACETGLGEIHHGEGVAGLRQAFQLAGAKAVVSSLWQVPDRDSALIMSDFFANCAAGMPKSQSLRAAQLKRIESRREKFGAAHPFFWAAWTYTGN